MLKIIIPLIFATLLFSQDLGSIDINANINGSTCIRPIYGNK